MMRLAKKKLLTFLLLTSFAGISCTSAPIIDTAGSAAYNGVINTSSFM